MVQCFKIILCIFVFLGNLSAESIQISFENDIKLIFDNIRNYSDDDVTTNDSSLNDSTAMLELYPKLDFAFKEGASIKTSWVFELLKDPAANNDFQGEGLVLDELYFSFENEDAEFFIGKVNPNFAYLWNYNLNSGIWTSDIAEMYKITGKIAIGGKIKMDLEGHGQHNLSVATFYYDDSNLSDALFTRRTISDNNIGVASDTGSLSSFTLNLFAEDLNFFDGLFYNASYRFLKNSTSLNIDDEEGYAVTVGFEKNVLNNLTIRPMVEYVNIENFNSFNNDFNQEFGDDQYLPADLESILFVFGLGYKSWNFNYMYSRQDYTKLLVSSNIKAKDEGFSMSYLFDNNITLRAGTRKSERDDVNLSKHTISVQLLYKSNF